MATQFFPLLSQRTPSATYFAELFLASGPQAIGETGQNRLQDFIGQEWMLLIDGKTREIQLWRENGVWERVHDPDHPLIDTEAPPGARRYSLCFDQAARPIVAYEQAGIIRVTRWDAVNQEYTQNVSFAGADPILFFDAVLGDRAGFPAAERAAAEAGVPVSFVWEPDGERYTNIMGDSDVIIFYLSTDRVELRARVQRELYQEPHEMAAFAEPVILDRATNIGGSYQLLISNAGGSPVDALVSDPYMSDFLISPEVTARLFAGVTPENIAQVGELFPYAPSDELLAGVTPENIAQVGSLLIYPLSDDLLDAGVEPENIQQVGSIYSYSDGDELGADVEPGDIIETYDTYPHDAEEDGLNANVQPENIRVQAV